MLQRQELIEWLIEQGQEAKAWDLDDDLPETLDSDEDGALLARHGIDVDSVLAQR
jgi:hypothetical protein